MRLWAHRGGGKGPLENTLEGFELAVRHGFSAVEFDVMVTADDYLIVHHDFRLGRLAKPVENSAIAADAKVGGLTSKQLLEVKLNGQPVLSFAEFVPFLIQHALGANVELKADSPDAARRLGAATLALLDEQSPAVKEQIARDWVFSSFYHASLLPLSGYRRAVLYEALPENWVIHADALSTEAVHIHWSGATNDVVRRVHATGRRVRVYTVNEASEFERLQGLGVDGVFTDCITSRLD